MLEDKFKDRFDLYESRNLGWTIAIELAGKDSSDGTSRIVLELDGYNPYFVSDFKDSPPQIRWIREPDSWKEREYPQVIRSGIKSRKRGYPQGIRSGPSSRKYDTVLGVLPAQDASMDKLSPVIIPGTYLVLGHFGGKPPRVLDAPISAVSASYTDYGL